MRIDLAALTNLAPSLFDRRPGRPGYAPSLAARRGIMTRLRLS
jgi:hypothetical protein